jgi:16S rRNA (uracil1498-N3)-methyltransferase
VEILTVQTDAEEFREPRLVLACAVVKGKRFEWALEKAVEVGAHEFLPLATDLGVVDARPGKQDRWRSLMVAALKQSGRSWLPVLSRPLAIKEVLERNTSGRVIFGAAPADTRAESRPLAIADVLAETNPAAPPESLTLLVGPEGGWTPPERDLMTRYGAQPVSLGPHVLRTETAAVSGLTFLQALRGRWLEG